MCVNVVRSNLDQRFRRWWRGVRCNVLPMGGGGDVQVPMEMSLSAGFLFVRCCCHVFWRCSSRTLTKKGISLRKGAFAEERSCETSLSVSQFCRLNELWFCLLRTAEPSSIRSLFLSAVVTKSGKCNWIGVPREFRILRPLWSLLWGQPSVVMVSRAEDMFAVTVENSPFRREILRACRNLWSPFSREVSVDRDDEVEHLLFSDFRLFGIHVCAQSLRDFGKNHDLKNLVLGFCTVSAKVQIRLTLSQLRTLM